jgi:thioredoxin 1
MIYKEGQMIWRQSGELDANTLIGIVRAIVVLLIFILY